MEDDNPADEGLHGIEGSFKVVAYKGRNPLYRHGPVRVAESRRLLRGAAGYAVSCPVVACRKR
jgi:hypothetical protein